MDIVTRLRSDAAFQVPGDVSSNDELLIEAADEIVSLRYKLRSVLAFVRENRYEPLRLDELLLAHKDFA